MIFGELMSELMWKGAERYHCEIIVRILPGGAKENYKNCITSQPSKATSLIVKKSYEYCLQLLGLSTLKNFASDNILNVRKGLIRNRTDYRHYWELDLLLALFIDVTNINGNKKIILLSHIIFE
jgi:hypothetical protein